MIRLYFGNPGSGKTTLICRNLFKLQKDKRCPYEYYFTNFSTTLARNVSLKGLGSWTYPEYSYIAVDEAGIEYNNRKFKSLDQQTIAWFKLHRHFKCDVDVFSQGLDVDITLMRLADQLWHVRKVGPFTLVRRIYKSVDIDKNTRQIIDAYKFGKMIRRFLPPPFHEKTWFLVFRPKYYKYFDTYERPNTPVLPLFPFESILTNRKTLKEKIACFLKQRAVFSDSVGEFSTTTDDHVETGSTVDY